MERQLNLLIVLVLVGMFPSFLMVRGENLGQNEGKDQKEQRLISLEKRFASLEAEQNKQANPETLVPYWKNGLRLDSLDKSIRLKIGGRIMNDWAFFAEEGSIKKTIGQQDNGTEFRRARLYISGLLYGNLKFKAQYDFAGGKGKFKDVYLGLKLPLIQNVMVGHFKEPFSLDELTSSKYGSFIERSISTVFAPSRNTGIQFNNREWNERATWSIGFFRDTDDFGDHSENGSYSVTGRLTGIPWEGKAKNLLHLGLGFSYRNPNKNTVKFSERPEAHLASKFVNTGNLPAEAVQLVGLEAALVINSLSIQSEFIHTFVDSPGFANPEFRTFYIQAGFFLTGEQRKYDRKNGRFSRTKLRQNFQAGKPGKRGAWEIATRYSYLDLNSENVVGGQLENITLGLNWHLNPNSRILWNFTLADQKDLGEAAINQIRFQVDF